jgi:hypothetical protein
VPRSKTTLPTNFNTAKGRTLSTWLNFDLCAGQRQVSQLGYSPLPINLVRGGLLQIDRIPGHVATPGLASLAGCDNPTFIHGQNILLKDAPLPSPCDKVGAPLNCVVKKGKATSTSPGTKVKPSSGPSPTSTSTSTSGPAPGVVGGAAPGATSVGSGPVTGVTVNLAATDRASQTTLAAITALAIVCAVAVPPVLAAWLRRRRKQADG